MIVRQPNKPGESGPDTSTSDASAGGDTLSPPEPGRNHRVKDKPGSTSTRWIRAAVRTAVSLAFIAVGIGAFVVLKNTKPAPEQTEITDRPRLVRTIVAEPRNVPRWWTGYATIEPINASEIAAEVTATVLERPQWVRAGARAEQGQVILSLDARDFESRVAQAEASIHALEAELDRLDVEIESLDDQIAFARESVDKLEWERDRLIEARAIGGSSDVEIERIRRQIATAKQSEEALRERRSTIPSRRELLRANIASAKADLRVAQLNVERCSVRAPFTGIIQSVAADTGERVNAGQVLLRLVDPDHLEIPVRLPASALMDIRVGSTAQVTPTAGGGGPVTATVARIAPEADPATRTIGVFLEVEQDEANRTLLPGQFVRAKVRSKSDEFAMLVPRSAIDDDRVYVVNAEKRAEARDVDIAFYVNDEHPEIDPIETQWAAVVAGLEPGDRVITSNLDEVVVGTLIQTEQDAEADEQAESEPESPE